jgi:hypothetical protein
MPGSGPLGDVGTLAVGLAATAVGIVMIVGAGRPLVRGIASLRWLPAPGTVQHAEIKPGGRMPALYLTYTYQVDGRTFTGTRYRFGEIGEGSSLVPGTPAVWRPGQPITVHYNPSAPERATVVTGLNPRACLGEVFLVIFGATFLGIGITQLLSLLGKLLGR